MPSRRTGAWAPPRTTTPRPSFGRRSSLTSRAKPRRIRLATGSLVAASSCRPRRQSAPRWWRAPPPASPPARSWATASSRRPPYPRALLGGDALPPAMPPCLARGEHGVGAGGH
jgi:hypothetical protein